MLNNLKFHHIAVATSDIAKSISKYQILGYTHNSEVYVDEIQGVSVCFLNKKGFPTIELVQPANLESPVNNILKKNGGVTPYHSCYITKNIDETVELLKKEKFILLNKPVKAIAFNNKNICFLYNKDVGLIELVEE